MRMLVNIAAALCVVAVVVPIWMQDAREAEERTRAAETVRAVRHIEQTLRAKVAFSGVTANVRGWPETIDARWFSDPSGGTGSDAMPRNALVPSEHPWIEIAPPEEAGLKHPPVRLAVSPTLAGLWYNPYQGVVRARVPVQVSDAKSVALYNQINGTGLYSIFAQETPLDSPVRPPIRHAEAESLSPESPVN